MIRMEKRDFVFYSLMTIAFLGILIMLYGYITHDSVMIVLGTQIFSIGFGIGILFLWYILFSSIRERR